MTELVLVGKASLVVVIGILVARAMSRSTASARHLVWTATIVGLLILPLVSALAPPLQLPLLPDIRSGQDEQRVSPLAVRSTARRPAAASLEAASEPPVTALHLPGFVAIVYLAGVVAGWTHIAVGWAGIRRLTESARPLNDLREWRSVRATHRGSLYGGRSPELLVSSSLTAPVTWGFWKPRVILPAAAAGWSTRDLRQALLHELAHVERGDWATRLLSQIACSLYWFHPLVWLAARKQTLESEKACDDRVLVAGAESSDYASQLLLLARRVRAGQGWHAAALPMARRSHLRRRVQSILDSGARRSPLQPAMRRLVFVLVCLPAVLLSPVSLVSAAAHEPARESPLGVAAAVGDATAVVALIDAGKDVDEELPGDGTPLIVAAKGGHLEVVRALLARGADVDLGIHGDGSPLIAAAGAGKLAVVRLLLDGGADIDLVVPGDENALIQAAGAGRLEVVRYLVERGADVNARVLANAEEVRTPLSQARQGRHAEVVDLLRAAGARR